MRLVYVLDTADITGAAAFWSAALGFDRAAPSPLYLTLSDPAGRWPDLLLQEVPEHKAGKNRMHLDMVVADLAAETERLTALGAVRRRAPFEEMGHRLAVLADPEGNEFCVVQRIGDD
ncbi:putative enzyme related to lactoylglutathione lyase [Murinocardiopsis flavida]|uniref:Putative enzyme related to lactoylglutathione lyase n=1 Tax=Murinocardiopsis flavida TaxID=645275 RepID=A0A2P8DJR5_9ACTN|nr:VOC family protein [Murinocardiopsis flavida]PSK97441.1 putative enzyme related to lactoylglutathione lyase [Murinocardiopsis flavida]